MSISVTNSLSLRVFYNRYTAVSSGSARSGEPTGKLSMADASALRNAIRKLQDYKFEDASKDHIQEKIKAFTDIMNNTITTATKYGANDSSVRNAASKLKKLNNEYASQLEKIGITVQKDGTMSLYENASSTYSAEKYAKFFDKDSEYLNSVYDAAKRITRRVDVRI